MAEQIIITVDGNKLGLQSPFDEAHTVYYLEKIKAAVVQPPRPSDEQRIIPAALVPRLNGHG